MRDIPETPCFKIRRCRYLMNRYHYHERDAVLHSKPSLHAGPNRAASQDRLGRLPHMLHNLSDNNKGALQ